MGVAIDVGVQAIENGGFDNIDAGQALRAGAIGAVGGGLSSIGKNVVSQAAKAGVKTPMVRGINSVRNITIGGATAGAEAINAGARGTDVLKDAAIDLGTAKIGGEIFDAIEGGDAIARDVGETMGAAAGQAVSAADQASQTESQPLQVEVRRSGCVNPDCSRPD